MTRDYPQWLTQPWNAFRLLPMIVIMVGIFYVSQKTGSQVHLPSIPGTDKLLHCFAYAVLGATYCYAFSWNLWMKWSRQLWVLVILLTVIYGASDEFHQVFVPGRDASFADLFADTCGGVMASTWWLSWLKKKGEILV